MRLGFVKLAALVTALMLVIATRGQSDLADLFAKTSPSVVTITTYDAAGRKLGQGSGFVIDKSGVVATCVHVVGNAATVEIQLSDGKTTLIANSVLRSDADSDAALLKVKGLSAEPLKLASREAIRIGAAVVAIGSPKGYGNTLSQGIISGLRPMPGGGEYIQITAPVSPGSSGGVLLSASSGEVLGMTSGSLTSGQNLNFAVPAHVLSDLLKNVPKSPERKLVDFKPEVKRAMAETKKARDVVENECSEADAAVINRAIHEALESGVPAYNKGDTQACFLIYAGAAYHILFSADGRSPTVSKILRSALEKADKVEQDSNAAARKAWIMREALDSINGIKGRKASNGK